MAKLVLGLERDNSRDAVETRLKKAREALRLVCLNPTRNFRMTIPVQDDDTDTLISDSLKDVKLLLGWMEGDKDEEVSRDAIDRTPLSE